VQAPNPGPNPGQAPAPNTAPNPAQAPQAQAQSIPQAVAVPQREHSAQLAFAYAQNQLTQELGPANSMVASSVRRRHLVSNGAAGIVLVCAVVVAAGVRTAAAGVRGRRDR
jgi:hypothetical protein